MILTNKQLIERIRSEVLDRELDYVVRKVFSSKGSGVHRLAPDVRTLLRREEPSPRIYQKEYLVIDPPPEEGQIGASGVDIRFGRLVAWTDTVRQNVTNEDLLYMPHKFLEPGEKFVLNHDQDGGRVYYVTSFESIRLPSDLEILVDSKSTTGRVGAMSHGVGWTDNREIVTMIQPYSFSLEVTCGKTALSQAAIRFRNSAYMGIKDILSGKYVEFEGDGQTLQENITSRGLAMKFATGLIYRAKKCDVPINMDAKRAVNPDDYWERIDGNSKITLDAKRLYLFGSLGVIKLGPVCGLLSREEQVLTGTGTWGHFAGIFQPWWKGGVTMEVYGFSKREIHNGDRAGVVIFDEIGAEIEGSYEGSYQNQKPPMLPKIFGDWNPDLFKNPDLV